LGAAVALASFLSLGSADATTSGFLIVGGTSYNLPTGTGVNGFDPSGWISANNFNINGGTPVVNFTSFAPGEGLFVTNGGSNVPLNVTFTFTYEGTEAGYTNVAESAFIYGNTALFVNHGPVTLGPNTYPDPAIGASMTEGFSLTTNPALVPFLFQSITGNTMAVNGGGITGGATQTAIAFYQVNDNLVYAFFDDSGAGPDRDFDDIVVRIDVSISGAPPPPVPLPGALPLFVSGLGAMGLLGWRRKRKAARAA
jgi:hypothetical protein